ncbi:MAG: replicative DNA helicase [Paludibacteraceae bacterium]|nr:replicative DNA helicase [Paludibacteraceae bacterium]MBQ2064461.1 replicative DNA helicase [Paludibacteraceae bacterium]
MAEENKRTTRKKEVSAVETAKLPPQALDCEEAVIGGLLVEPSAFYEVAAILRKDYFYSDRHKYIFEAMFELSNNHQPIDYLTVSDQMQKDGTLEKAGGKLALAELSEKISSAVNIESYAEIVAQKYMARELIRVATEIQNQAYDPQTDVKDLIADTERNVFEVTQTNVRQDAVQVNDVIREVFDKIQTAGNNKGNYTGVPSGFTGLDDIIYGWQPGTLNVIAARPAMGKTAFALSMARNMAVDYGKRVCVFSLEMSTVELTTRLLVNVSEIEGEKIKKGNLAPYEWEILSKKAQLLSDAKLFIDDTPGLTIFELCSKARKLKRTENLDCIIIDYLQLVNATIKNGTREQEVSFVSRSLKALAKELQIPVIALAQLNRGVESRSNDDKRPQLSDLRESGAIEQDADVVIMLHRPEYYKITQDSKGNDLTGLAMVIIAKHRSGSIDDIWLRFQKNYIKFANLNNADSASEYKSVLSDNNSADNEPFANQEHLVPDNNVPF